MNEESNAAHLDAGVSAVGLGRFLIAATMQGIPSLCSGLLMPKTDTDRVIALAGVVQASDTVRNIAEHGQADHLVFTTCIESLLHINAASSADVYGGLHHLVSGLHILERQLHQPQDVELTQYVFNLLHLERKLRRRQDFLQLLRSGIQDILANLEHFPVTHSNTIARFADLYVQTISTMTPRIMVRGNPAHLNNPENAKRIRALLLAGVRAAMLWRQSGGGRWTLLLRRNVLLRETRSLLTSCEPPSA